MRRRLRAWSTAAFGRVASAGAVALTGCAVHHYHHFEPAPPERAALIAPPIALPTLTPNPSPPGGEGRNAPVAHASGSDGGGGKLIRWCRPRR